MINNEFYKELGEKWFTSEGDAIALLRLENETKLPWVRRQIAKYHGAKPCAVLDVGCGGGFLTHALARDGHACTGVDVSEEVVAAARARDSRGVCRWAVAPAEELPFADRSFDVVCAMDVLEHVRDSRRALREAMRVVKSDGTILVHTFNRTWSAWLFAEKGIEWWIRGTPRHVHDWRLFIKPSEFAAWMESGGFEIREWAGIGPRIFSRAFAELLLTRRVPEDFQFLLKRNLRVGYLAAARLRPGEV